ncbi:MAG: DUF2953 domain-containing protein [Nitrososphaerales archaeon]
MAIVLIIVIILAAVIVSVLLIPFTVNLGGSVSLEKPAKLDLSVSWLGLTFWRSKEKKKAPEKKPPPEKKGFDVKGGIRILSLVRDSIPSFVILGRYAKKATHIQNLNLDLTFGLGDPAETAEAAGYLWSVVGVLNALPPVSISLTPNVQEFDFDGELGMKARIRALFLVVGFLRAYMKKPFRLLIMEVRARRKKQVKDRS